MDPSSGGSSSSSVPPCKFFLAGSCTKPDCAFAHDVQTAPTTVCPFYKKGRENSCTYGDKCRYDHVTERGTTTSDNRTSTRTGTMNTKAAEFIPTRGPGAGAYLSQQL